ncbi:hypothetical protein KAU34_04690 [candidate division WOR-3 bacterium]|nr:hypothetical protein [candidate division WOR-3 bacterium]
MLKDRWKSLKEEKRDMEIAYERLRKLEVFIKEFFPEEIDAELSMSGELGKDCLRAFIYLEKDVTEEETVRAVSFLTKHIGNGKRFFRESEGKFAWQSKIKKEDRDGEYEEMIFIENACVPECKVREVTKEKTFYEYDCPGINKEEQKGG